MNIHEYQAKELLDKYGVTTPRGAVASTPEEAEAVARSLGTNKLVVKAQIHSGGRGKGTFTNGFQGGVRVCKTANEVRDVAESMLGQTLVTVQTGAAGRKVRKLLVVESKEIKRELYFAVTIDRVTKTPVIIASQHGGMDIEDVAKNHPNDMILENLHPLLGLTPSISRKIAFKLGFSGTNLRTPCKLFDAVYNLFTKSDCSLVEINPLVETVGGEVIALDAKLNFDDNALFRHPDIMEMRDTGEEDPREVEASKSNLNYIGLDGNIGCMVNGAGLAMATMDIIKHYGGNPANFLDVGGGASEQQVTEAFKLLVSDSNVQAILVNIFGGIMRCDVIAQGVINAYLALERAEARTVPLVVRLEGTNVDAGKKLLRDSKLPIIAADTLADAAEKVVKATKGE